MNKLHKNDKRGFILVELLLVVVIIVVLMAISIPIFTIQLEKSREATDLANVRAAYAEVMTVALTEDSKAKANYNTEETIKKADGTYSLTVKLRQQKKDWQTDMTNVEVAGVKAGTAEKWTGIPVKDGTCTITYTPSDTNGANENFVIAWSGTAE